MKCDALSIGGPVPQTPWDLSLWADMQIGGRHALRHADRAANCLTAALGARVASLHCPVLRVIHVIMRYIASHAMGNMVEIALHTLSGHWQRKRKENEIQHELRLLGVRKSGEPHLVVYT